MKTMVRFLFNAKIYVWVLLLVILTFLGLFLAQSKLLKTAETSQSYLMVKSIQETNAQVFLNVGIQDVETKTTNTKIPWTKIGIPLTEKKALIILNYNAKLGIKTPAKITATGKNKYHIEIPNYEVIGIALDSKKPYVLYDSSGEILSDPTQNIDTGALVTTALSNTKQEKFLKQYQTQMDQSAKNYYTSLFKAVDPKLSLTFTFNH
ncbi:DUF4230 domain-containing protein [Lactococcus hircilactis]|uniref:DUF4230 domain-containing protein n=1 Tax=Lactococcus hircilactis TaxID=1494462 RepID=UPI003FA1D00E